jgi:hypothetical protein
VQFFLLLYDSLTFDLSGEVLVITIPVFPLVIWSTCVCPSCTEAVTKSILSNRETGRSYSRLQPEDGMLLGTRSEDGEILIFDWSRSSYLIKLIPCGNFWFSLCYCLTTIALACSCYLNWMQYNSGEYMAWVVNLILVCPFLCFESTRIDRIWLTKIMMYLLSVPSICTRQIDI